MKLTIGVMGASGGTLSEESRQRVYRLGEAIAARGVILITGGCPGLPYEAVRGAKARGGLVVGISPACPSTSIGGSTVRRWKASTCWSTPVVA